MQVCWTHRPESKLSHRHRRTDLGFFTVPPFPKPLNCFPDRLRKKPCKQVDCPNCASTVCSYPKGGAFTTKLDLKNYCFINNKTVFGTRNPAFWVGAVMCCPSFSRCHKSAQMFCIQFVFLLPVPRNILSCYLICHIQTHTIPSIYRCCLF